MTDPQAADYNQALAVAVVTRAKALSWKREHARNVARELAELDT